jgi:hypothetical protein
VSVKINKSRIMELYYNAQTYEYKKLMIMMSGDQIVTEGKEDGVRGMYGGKEERIQSFGVGTTRKT